MNQLPDYQICRLPDNKIIELVKNLSRSGVSVLFKNTLEHLVAVEMEPVTFQLQVGLTQSSCMSAGSQV